MLFPGQIARLGSALLAATGIACADRAPTAPAPAAVTPPQGTSDAPVPVEISGAAFSPGVSSNFGHAARGAVDAVFSAHLAPSGGDGGVDLLDVQWMSISALAATVPAGLSEGFYDLTVMDPAGRSGTLTQAYRVVTPAQNVDRFQIESVGPQRVGIPFLTAITALDTTGRVVGGFGGTVNVSDMTGTAAPAKLGPFSLGQIEAVVQVSALTPADSLAVADGLGHSGLSNTFAVTPGLPIQLTLSTPAPATAGLCSGPVVMTVRDGLGNPATVEASLTLTLGAAPGGMTFFSDAACTQAITSAALPPGESSLTVYGKSSAAATFTLRVSPDALPSALGSLVVGPASPVALSFTTSAQSVVAGACSGAVGIGVVDAFGNAAVIGQDTPTPIASNPASAVVFYSDAFCVTATTAVTLKAGAGPATFRFRGSAPVIDTVSATAPGLSGASQDEQVTP